MNITANVTDAGSVDVVFANITLPNGSTRRITMTNASSTIYRTNFSETSLNGTYNITIIANDSSNNIATLGGANFNITLPVPVISFISPTPANGSTVGGTSVVVNVSVDKNVTNCTLSVVNGSISNLGDGSDGVLSVTAANVVVNNYTYLTGNVSVGGLVLPINSSAGFIADDEVLVMQMQNGSAGIAGRFEFVRVANISGNNLNLSSGLNFSYFSGVFDATNPVVTQVVRVPQFTNATIASSGSVTASAWNGYVGGVVVWRARDLVNITGTINASLKGFRAGVAGSGGPEQYDGRISSSGGNGMAATSISGGAGGNGSASGTSGGGGGAFGGNVGGSGGKNHGGGGSGGSKQNNGVTVGGGGGGAAFSGGAQLTPSSLSLIMLGGGGSSGAGGGSQGATSSSGGGFKNGTGGSGNCGNAGSAGNNGNAGGGVIIIFASNISASGNIESSGGLGGSGGNGGSAVSSGCGSFDGGGGGGGSGGHGSTGGVIYLLSSFLSGSYNTTNGGNGGAGGSGGNGYTTGGGNGQAGGNGGLFGGANATAGTTGSDTSDGGAGGGGGSGGAAGSTGVFANATLNTDRIVYNMSIVNADASTSANTSITISDGVTYTYGADCYDTTGRIGTSGNRTLTASTSGPTIVNVTPNGTKFVQNATVNITANVTDTLSVDTVFANITLPNGSTRRLTMANASSTIYRTNFSETGTIGLYNLTIIANDSSNNIATAASNFTINSSAPVIQFTNPTPSNNSEITSNFTTINVSVNKNVTNCTLNWNYGSTFGDGSDSVLSVNSANVVVNNYTFLVRNESSGNLSIVVNSSAGFAAGNQILIIQMQNASGGVAGRYEYATISSIAGNNLTLSAVLNYSYSSGVFDTTSTTVTQVVRVPQYTTVLVNTSSSITATAWNGYIGGIVVFRVQNTLNVTGILNLSAVGFRGGSGAPASDQTGYQGESYNGKGTQSTSSNLGGGGGGSRHNPGAYNPDAGGGGGYATGGSGPTANTNSCGCTSGSGSYGVANLTYIYFGSGAGGGGSKTTDGGNGGSGGGIALIHSDSILVSGTIQSNGGTGVSVASNDNNGDAGGGGAGGSIYLLTNNLTLGSNLVTATAGSGGTSSHSNGGAGSTGRIRLDFTTISGTTNPAQFNGTISSVTVSGTNNMTLRNADASTSANATIINLLNETTYTYYAQCFDTDANGNTTETRTLKVNTTSSIDTTAPIILNVSPNATNFANGSIINISANVSDDTAVDTVFANITLPNASTRRITLASVGGLYRGNFSETAGAGNYNFTILANDSSSNNASALSNFTINQSGCGTTLTSNVTLTSNLSASGNCYQINANNVVLDCNGFSITGNGTGIGVNASGKNNVTIQKCTLLAFTTDVSLVDSNNSKVVNSTMLNSTNGIILGNLYGFMLRDNRFGNLSTAVRVSGNGTIINQTFGNVLRESLHITNDLRVRINQTVLPANITIENLTSNFSQMIYVVQVDLITDTLLSSFINLKQGFVFVNSSLASRLNKSGVIRVNTDSLPGRDIAHDKYNTNFFMRCPENICRTISTSGNFVVFNVSGFSSFKVTKLVNGSFISKNYNFTDRYGNLLDDFEQGEEFQFRHGNKRLGGFAMRNNSDLSKLNLTQNDSVVALFGFNETENLTGTHTLYLPNTNGGIGVFVCPSAFSISQVNDSCPTSVNFTGPFPQTQMTGAGNVTVSIDGDDYVIAGLNQSGGGQRDPTPANVANGTDVVGAAVSVNKSERFNGTVAGISITQGGNTTQINFTTNTTTNKWSGFYGNASGSLLLGAGKQTLFNFGNVTPLFVAITQDSNFNFVSIAAANTTLVDRHFGFNENDTDSTNKTFNSSGKKIAGISGVPFVDLQSGTWFSGIFDNGSANSSVGNPLFYAFGVEVNVSQTDFAGGTSDFELLVGTNQTSDVSRNTVFFFMDIQ
ncbi:MAG: hypothetical protein AABX52_02155 [Nanoarchaeota archaeon]